ncbi:hypothetical protein DBR11_13580 [Pedobacter sp. HMWF019]|nr:hypothetical protein DBR11_13580 [Pedobacter sp. HMWF019]
MRAENVRIKCLLYKYLRMVKMCRHKLLIFERLGIDESKGDRLLITCDIPSKSKLDILKSKLVKFSIINT